jgi:hypothetical protein
MKTSMLLSILVLCALPAEAQTVGSGASVGSGQAINSVASLNSSSGLSGVAFPRLPSNPATQLRITVIVGSSATFVPSSFLPYRQAVEAGAAGQAYSLFLNYHEAIAEGMVELAAKPKSVAQAALENRSEERPKASAAFVQDRFGRVVRQAE